MEPAAGPGAHPSVPAQPADPGFSSRLSGRDGSDGVWLRGQGGKRRRQRVLANYSNV